MSKIGRVNLELTEEANELGYDSVGEAIADGWEANEIAATLTKKDELREAHEAWLEEKEDTIAGLKNAKDFIETLCEKSGLAPAWRRDYERQARRIDRAITFIKEAHE